MDVSKLFLNRQSKVKNKTKMYKVSNLFYELTLYHCFTPVSENWSLQIRSDREMTSVFFFFFGTKKTSILNVTDYCLYLPIFEVLGIYFIPNIM